MSETKINPGESLRRLLEILRAQPAPRAEHKNPPPFDVAELLAATVRRDAAQRRKGTIRTHSQDGVHYAEPVGDIPAIPPAK